MAALSKSAASTTSASSYDSVFIVELATRFCTVEAKMFKCTDASSWSMIETSAMRIKFVSWKRRGSRSCQSSSHSSSPPWLASETAVMQILERGLCFAMVSRNGQLRLVGIPYRAWLSPGRTARLGSPTRCPQRVACSPRSGGLRPGRKYLACKTPCAAKYASTAGVWILSAKKA